MINIVEIFPSIQGEVNVGRYCLFVRLGGCNLECGWCDTKYAYTRGVNIPVKEIVEKCLQFNRVVITGGEPTLQKDKVARIINSCCKKKNDIVFEVETNGTNKLTGLQGTVHFNNSVQFNVGLKLKNSGNEYDKRIVPNVIYWYLQQNAIFKFVVNNNDDLSEVNQLVTEFGIPRWKVFLMPEGKTEKEQLEKMKGIAELAVLHRYNFSPRMHVLLWGNKRGV